MVYAVYRILYGEDFIKESINSVLDEVDKVFIFWTDKTLTSAKSVVYRGETVVFPEKFDNVIELIKDLNSPKIHLIYDHMDDNRGQFTHLVNDHILPNHPTPNIVVFLEPDYVFNEGAFKEAIDEFKASPYKVARTRQIELWRTPQYVLPERAYRVAAVFWKSFPVTETGRHATPELEPPVPQLKATLFNLGFCLKPKNMYWKHLIGIAIANGIQDSAPNELWYENKWLNWDMESNNSNLEISSGHESSIPFACEFDVTTLPQSIREKCNV